MTNTYQTKKQVNDYREIFVEQLAIGHGWATYVADALNDRGVRCEVTEMEICKDLEDAKRFADEKDIIFNDMPGYLDVKSKAMRFNSDPDSFPYTTAFVDTEHGWNQKKEKPLAVILVSQFTKEMLVVPPSTSSTWKPVRKRDRIRNIWDNFLQIRKSDLRRFDDLVQWLLARQDRFKNTPL